MALLRAREKMAEISRAVKQAPREVTRSAVSASRHAASQQRCETRARRSQRRRLLLVALKGVAALLCMRRRHARRRLCGCPRHRLARLELVAVRGGELFRAKLPRRLLRRLLRLDATVRSHCVIALDVGCTTALAVACIATDLAVIYRLRRRRRRRRLPHLLPRKTLLPSALRVRGLGPSLPRAQLAARRGGLLPTQRARRLLRLSVSLAVSLVV
eukprot:3636170-Pleurochrysis_carterae.AAC.1